MGFFPLPDISLGGSTPGAVTGESVELLPHFQLLAGQSATIEVRVIANGWLFPGIRAIQSFVRRFSVQRSTGGVTTIDAVSTLEQIGDAGASSWAVAASVGVGPDRFALTFSTGSTRAVVSVEADFFVTKFTFHPPVPPAGYIQFLRGDVVVTSGPTVTSWTDQSGHGYSEVPSSGTTLLNPSDAAFNNQPVLYNNGYLGTSSPPTESLTGVTYAFVVQPSGSTFAICEASGAAPPAFGAAVALGTTAGGNPFLQYGLSVTGATGGTSPLIALFTMSPNGAVSPVGVVYVSSYTTSITGSMTGEDMMSTITGVTTNTVFPIAEQIIWPFILNSSEIHQYMEYASARYGITLI